MRTSVVVVPRHHIYGFLRTAMLPARLGAETLEARRWNHAKLVGELRGGDLLVGVPAIWSRISEALHVFPKE